jgi:multidrug efflux pump subunit AcrB
VRWPVPFGAPRPDIPRTIYSAVLRLALRHPATTCAAMLLLVVTTLIFVLPLVLVFAEPPQAPAERIEIIAKLPAGSTIDISDALAVQLEALAADVPQVDEVRTRVSEEEVRVTIAFLEEDDRSGPLLVDRERETLRRKVGGISPPPGLGSERLDIEVDPPPEEGSPEQANPLAGARISWTLLDACGISSSKSMASRACERISRQAVRRLKCGPIASASPRSAFPRRR